MDVKSVWPVQVNTRNRLAEVNCLLWNNFRKFSNFSQLSREVDFFPDRRVRDRKIGKRFFFFLNFVLLYNTEL